MKQISTADILRVVVLIAGAGTILTPDVLSTLLGSFYVPSDAVTRIVHIVGGVIFAAGLIETILARAVPSGMNTVIAPNADPTPDNITTKAAMTASAAAPAEKAPQ